MYKVVFCFQFPTSRDYKLRETLPRLRSGFFRVQVVSSNLWLTLEPFKILTGSSIGFLFNFPIRLICSLYFYSDNTLLKIFVRCQKQHKFFLVVIVGYPFYVGFLTPLPSPRLNLIASSLRPDDLFSTDYHPDFDGGFNFTDIFDKVVSVWVL